MNRKEFLEAVKHDPSLWKWCAKCKKIQQSLIYNNNPDATTKHHLLDTEEQIKYNNEHYELFGFEIDENGNEHFEYGKYIIFVTNKEHKAIHAVCKDTRKKISVANKGRKKSPDEIERQRRTLKRKWATDENYRNKMLKIYRSDEWRNRMSRLRKGKQSWNKGRITPDEVKAKISASEKGKIIPDSVRKKISENNARYWKGKRLSEEHKRKVSENHADVSGENNPMYGTSSPMKGKHHSNETKQKMSNSWTQERKQAFKEKCSGENNGMFGKVYSDEEKEFRRNVTKSLWENPEYRERQARIRRIKREAYSDYISSGGTLKYRNFIREIYNKNNS